MTIRSKHHGDGQVYMDNMDLYYIITFIVLLPGILANVLFLAFILRHPIGGKASSILLRLQTGYDMIVLIIACIFSFQEVIHVNSAVITGAPLALNEIICRMWDSQFFYWLLVSISVWNLVAMAVDRFFCIVFPFTYQNRGMRAAKIGIFISYFLTITDNIPIAVILPHMINGSCIIAPVSTIEAKVIKYTTVSWEILFFIIPSIGIFLLYSGVIITLKRSALPETENARGKAAKRLTYAMILVSAVFVACFSLDGILLLNTYLNPNSGISYYGTMLQKVGLFLVSVNSAVNPMVYFIMFKAFRTYLKTLIKHKKAENDPTHTEMTQP